MHSSSPRTGASMTDRDATQQPKQVQNNMLSVSFPPDFTHLRSPLYPHRIPCRHTHTRTKTERNPQGVPSHCAILTLLTYCSTRRKEQQWIWTRENLAWEQKESYYTVFIPVPPTEERIKHAQQYTLMLPGFLIALPAQHVLDCARLR